ncbi:hypothetical protein KUV80_12965 [Fictibacillus nanhaiensis]|uniref:hypothetical protein n=1 Tax=Fictibacillus nanhaiensis TaxID=742169 RepID=UPI001C957CDA|nr:hypothetical protein [Fictibacillus nanhaiensis]MBY6037574.1 hypothetical protein [Fictibacillus nanhaiensis]
MIDFLLNMLAGGVGDNSLDTKKIDKHIEQMKKYSWFAALYDDENYHSLFFVSRRVRAYLQSSFRVKRMIHNEKAREKFVHLLNKQR